MKRYTPIALSLVVVIGVAWFVKELKASSRVVKQSENLGVFGRQQMCAKHPNFLQKLRISPPIAIDLSQKAYKGLAFRYGRGLTKVLHLKTWEKFDHFSNYSLAPNGDMFLSPMPYISIKKHTFEFQKNIYRVDSNSGNLSVWLTLDDVKAGANNPYGVTDIEYDCSDNTLWVSAIDESDYFSNRGVIYHIDVKTKKILERMEGVDALSIKLLSSSRGKFLLIGDARKNRLYALEIKSSMLQKRVIELFNLPTFQEHIGKIRVKFNGRIDIDTIPFSYSLIVETTEGEIRKKYSFEWSSKESRYLEVR